MKKILKQLLKKLMINLRKNLRNSKSIYEDNCERVEKCEE